MDCSLTFVQDPFQIGMRQSSGVKISDDKKMSSKKSSRKAAVIFILVIVAVFLAIWFGGEYLATETVISETPVHLNGQDRILKFSEKTNKHRMKNADNFMESGISHFAYFIELIDADSKASLDKIRFKSPVNEIQKLPVLIAFPDGKDLVVLTTDVDTRDRRGFILKFVIDGDKISEAGDF